jgi:hypothetical protein
MELSLYKISSDTRELIEKIAEADGELTDNQDKLLVEMQYQLRNKVEGVVHWVNYQQDLIKAGKERIAELEKFIEKTNRSVERFNDYVSTCMSMLSTNKIEFGIYSIVKTKPREVVEIYDENLIPIEFIKMPPPPEPVISKQSIAKVLKDGIEVPGARLIESQKTTINYKVK